jgi:hypothetical protein
MYTKAACFSNAVAAKWQIILISHFSVVGTIARLALQKQSTIVTFHPPASLLNIDTWFLWLGEVLQPNYILLLLSLWPSDCLNGRVVKASTSHTKGLGFNSRGIHAQLKLPSTRVMLNELHLCWGNLRETAAEVTVVPSLPWHRMSRITWKVDCMRVHADCLASISAPAGDEPTVNTFTFTTKYGTSRHGCFRIQVIDDENPN